MANQIIRMAHLKTKLIFVLISLVLITFNPLNSYAKKLKIEKDIFLTNLNHINITEETAKDIKTIQELIITKRPKAVYLEHWITDDPKNKNLPKKLKKIANKYDAKFYLVIGRNSWFGTRGLNHTIDFLNRYENDIDGLVLRTEPNKVNVWKDDLDIQAQILNQMLDAYSAINIEMKKRGKQFIVEYPFWFSDFLGPGKKSFSQHVCEYSSKIIFLIDNLDKLDELYKLKVVWNDISCPYNINLTKRATGQDEKTTHQIYRKLKERLTLYSNFNGFLIDSDSTLKDIETDPKA